MGCTGSKTRKTAIVRITLTANLPSQVLNLNDVDLQTVSKRRVDEFPNPRLRPIDYEAVI